MDSKQLSSGIHLMAKPSGASCNLQCQYCFYLEKQLLYANATPTPPRMGDQVLEAYIKQSILCNCNNPAGILFTWQGGEPTLMGLDFFRRALSLEKKYAEERPICNSFQTNGTLLDDEWCAWFAENRFLVGLSLDGGEAIHNRYRVGTDGRPSFEQTLRALKLLQKHGVEYNVLASVAHHTAAFALEVYRFFKQQGVEFIQFSPIVERLPDPWAQNLGLKFAAPPRLDRSKKTSTPTTTESVESKAYGDFLISIFEEWVRHDVGKIFVMNFEWTLFNCIGGDGAICYLSKECGNALIVEHNGDLYSCDHFVYPQYKLGNILSDDVQKLVNSPKHQEWGRRKESMLPKRCKECEVLFICRGGCPKDRLSDGLNYLCSGYKAFYNHTAKYMKAFQQLMKYNLPLENIMRAIGQPLVIPASPATQNQEVVLWIK
ncbi:MAG: anaerobic sulfatase maturase [Oligoflexia bacterium]|nr:anaerobic sulfatase maturase [Oligoflexia bacterium]